MVSPSEVAGGSNVDGLLLPASAQCAIKLHEVLVFGAARLGECEFSGKERPLAVQDFEISRGAASVTHDGEANRLRQVSNGLLLANSHLMRFLISDQGIGHISEGVLNGLLVSNQSLLVLRFSKMQVSLQRTPRENGLAHLGAVRPDTELRAHQAGECAAPSEGAAAGAGQRDLWKELSFGDANFGIRGNEHLLRFANIGPSLEQRGSQTWGHLRRKHLPFEGPSTRHALRVIAEEYADGIFLLANLSLEIRDLRISGVEHLLSLKHI